MYLEVHYWADNFKQEFAMKISLKSLALGLILPVFPAHASVMYTLVDLMPENTSINSGAVSINELGHVLGFTGGGESFVYKDNNLTMLSVPRYSSLTGINSNGVVVGNSAGRGIVHSNGVTQIIGGFSGSPFSSVANGINDAGQVVGSAWNTEGNQRATIASNGSLTDLGALNGGSWSAGNAINSSGQVTGASQTAYGAHAFVTRNGQMVDLGAFAWGTSTGYAINDAGQVAGTSHVTSNEKHAFITTVDDQMIDIGLAGYSSEAFGINNTGQAVGYFGDNSGGAKRAFVTINGVMTDLNTLISASLGWTLSTAYDVNNSGQIVGVGIAANGVQRAFLLNPVTSVPIPGAIWLFGSMLLSFVSHRLRA
jgi:probable HAF family extracellular repeat protein